MVPHGHRRVPAVDRSDHIRQWHSGYFVNYCCILTPDRAVNQILSAQDALVKMSGYSHVVERKYVGITKIYMQMPTRETGSLSLESVSTCDEKRIDLSRRALASGGAASHRGPPVEYSRLRRNRSAKWDLEDKMAWYGQKKLWVNIAVYLVSLCSSLCLSPIYRSLCLSPSYRIFQPF